MSERLTLTVPEAAQILGVSRGVAYEAARTGELETIRLGRRLLVPRARLMALLGEQEASFNNDIRPAGEPGAVKSSAGRGRHDEA
jgi:excisionase family DNA binding protein